MYDIEWRDISEEEDMEQYRFHIPGFVLADLMHFDYEDMGRQVDNWRLCLAKPKPNGDDGIITDDHDLDEPVSANAAKEWAEPLVARFLA